MPERGQIQGAVPIYPTLFGVTGAKRAPGNTIRKVYLCRSMLTRMDPGDVLLFYLSKDSEYLYSQSIATVGVVVSARQTNDIDELFRIAGKRSVFSENELRSMLAEKTTSLKIIDFLLVGHFDEPVGLRELIDVKILSAPPQSITEVSRDAYKRLDVYPRLGFSEPS